MHAEKKYTFQPTRHPLCAKLLYRPSKKRHSASTTIVVRDYSEPIRECPSAYKDCYRATIAGTEYAYEYNDTPLQLDLGA